MRKFKVGDVYSADCFNSRDEKIDRKGGYWHFKIIEVVYGHYEGKTCNLYIGIKVDMGDYQCPSANYLSHSIVRSFEKEIVSQGRNLSLDGDDDTSSACGASFLQLNKKHNKKERNEDNPMEEYAECYTFGIPKEHLKRKSRKLMILTFA